MLSLIKNSLGIKDQETFPMHDSFHADCTLITTFNATCAEVYTSLTSTIQNFDDPAKGVYATKQAE